MLCVFKFEFSLLPGKRKEHFIIDINVSFNSGCALLISHLIKPSLVLGLRTLLSSFGAPPLVSCSPPPKQWTLVNCT